MEKTIDNRTIKVNISMWLIIMILFINASLYNSDSVGLFIKITATLLAVSWFFLLIKIGSIKKFLKTKFFIWITLVFILYEFYGFAKHVYGNFNWDYLLVLYASIITICALYTSIPDSHKMNSLYKICAFSSIAICFYILINEYSNIIRG